MNKLMKVIKLAIILLIFLIIFFKIEEIADCIAAVKAKIFSNVGQQKNAVMTEVDFSEYSPLIDEKDAWYCNNSIVAHGGGVYMDVYIVIA
ncbi:MAG: hypothetical protein K2O91_24570 [Lachnospiraceae bacterium]|nr:hypothetical protein [Lachnospiraceae bacterium]